MQRTEMNKGVQILLERMQSNPEEFTPDWRGDYPPKWRKKLDAIARRASHINDKRKNKDVDYYPELPFLKDEEILELWHAMQDLLATQFTEEIMATLLHEASLDDDDFPFGKELSSFSQGLNEGLKNNGKINLTQADLSRLQCLDPYEKEQMLRALNEYRKIQRLE